MNRVTVLLIAIIVVELLTLGPFTMIYMADKGLLLSLSILLLFSSLAYGLVAAGFKALLDKVRLSGDISLLAGLLVAGVLNSVILYLTISRHNEDLAAWETLGVLLSVYNIHAFIAIGFNDVTLNNLYGYMYINALTSSLIPWVLISILFKRYEFRSFYEALAVISVTVALSVRIVVYPILLFWYIVSL